jgi:hypothetical protein
VARPTDWNVLDLTADPVPGDPWNVKALGAGMGGLGDVAADAARGVRGLLGDHAAMNWIGAAGDAFRDAIGKFPGQLDKVADSYHQCSAALTTYAAALDGAQAQADKALAQARPLFTQVSTLQGQLASANAANTSAANGVHTLDAATAPKPQALAAATKAAATAQSTVTALNSQLSGPEAQLAALKTLATQAAGLRDTAADTAVRKINAATDAGIPPDSFWHKLGEICSAVWNGLVLVAKIVSLIGGLVLLIVGGPLWLIIAVVAAGLIILADTLYKVSQGKATWTDVAWAVLACIPMTKGLSSLAEISDAFKAGNILGVGLHLGGAVLGSAKDLLTGMADLLRGGGGADVLMLLRSTGRIILKPDLLMNMDSVLRVAGKYGIDLTGVSVDFDKLVRGLGSGQTFTAKGFTLYSEAFKKGLELVRGGDGATVYLDGEGRLARTLYHEMVHVNELRSGVGFPKTAAGVQAFEDRAWAAETQWWNDIGSAIQNGGGS